MKNFGKPLVFMGVVLLLIAFNMDTSVESGYGRVHNIGLMSKQNNFMIFGSILLVAGLIISVIKDNSNQSSDESTIKCPFCAELIKRDAKICKHCKSEISPNPDEAITFNEQQIATKGPDDNPIPSEPKLAPAQPINTEPDRSKINSSVTARIESSATSSEVISEIQATIGSFKQTITQSSIAYIENNCTLAVATLSSPNKNIWDVTIDFAGKTAADSFIFAAEISLFVILALIGIGSEREFFLLILAGIAIAYFYRKAKNPKRFSSNDLTHKLMSIKRSVESKYPIS